MENGFSAIRPRFANGIALLEEALRKQQELAGNLENNARKVDLKISEKKLKL